MKIEFKEGSKCSKNFILKANISTFEQLIQVLKTQPSIFWRHRPYPCAFIVHQPLHVLMKSIEYKNLWEIQPLTPKRDENTNARVDYGN